MPRTCFVIMPFSAAASCTEEEWTLIFEALLKPAVEGAGLDYECRRSVATRAELLPLLTETVNTLNQRDVPDRIQEDRILELAQEYIPVVEPIVQKVEEFVLTSVEEQWALGLRLGLRLSGDWISFKRAPTSRS